MPRIVWVLAAVCIVLAGCGDSTPAPLQPVAAPDPTLTVTLVGGSDQNPDGNGEAAPVAVRAYQLTETARFAESDSFTLVTRQDSVLGDQVLRWDEFIVSPTDRRKVSVPLAPRAVAIGFVVLFREIDDSNWRRVLSVSPGSSGEIRLLIERQSFAVEALHHSPPSDNKKKPWWKFWG